MTYHELVKKVQTALAKADASKVEGHIAVQVNVTGEAEGAFYMEIADGVLYVAPYDYNDRDALLTAEGENVLDVAQGKITLEAAIAEGKVAHEGDYDKTLTLGSVIPVKKTRAAKAKAEAAVEKVEEKAEAVAEKIEEKVEEVKKTTRAKKATATAAKKTTTKKTASKKAAKKTDK